MKITDGMVRVLRSMQAGEVLTRKTSCEVVYRLTGRVLPLKRETVAALDAGRLVEWSPHSSGAHVADLTPRGLAAIAAYGLPEQSLAMLRRMHKFDPWYPRDGRAGVASYACLHGRKLIDGYDRLTDLGRGVLALFAQ